MPASKAHSGKIELTQVLSKVRLRGFSEAVDREGSALPQMDLVRIHLEDLLLL